MTERERSKRSRSDPKKFNEQVLAVVHYNLSNKFNGQSKKHVGQAQKIQEVLQEMKKAVLNLDNQIDFIQDDEAKEATRQMVINAFEQTVKVYGSNAKSLKASAFRLFEKENRSMSYKDKSWKDIFELSLASLLSSGLKEVLATDLIVGNESSSFTGVANKTEKQLDSISNSIVNAALSAGKETVKITKNKRTGKEQKRQVISTNVREKTTQKVDLDVPFELLMKIDVDADPMVRKLIEVMAGKKFSIKNYVGARVDTLQTKKTKQKSYSKFNASNFIGFGSSNIYKAIMGGLTEFGGSFDKEMIYWRGMTYLTDFNIPPNSTTKDVVIQHFNHLRAIFEIKGSGLQKQVDFVIWNDPRSERIYVRDVYSLLYSQLLLQNYTETVFDSIRMTFNDFINSVQLTDAYDYNADFFGS